MNGIKLTATLVLTGLCLHATSIAAKTFEINVSAAGLPVFTDCLTFEGEGQFRLARDPLNMSWTYGLAGHHIAFMATTQAGDRVNTTLRLAIHGRIHGSRIIGNMLNSHGQTFVFYGTASGDCKTVSALSAGSSEYSTLPVFDFLAVPVTPDVLWPEFPDPLHERSQQSVDSGPFDSPFGQVYEPPYDCFGFSCGLPQQGTKTGSRLNPVDLTQTSFAGVYQPPYDCFGFDCGVPRQPTNVGDLSATDEKRRTSFDGVFQALADCVGSYCGFPSKPVVKPPYDCINSDCPPRPDDPSATDEKRRTSFDGVFQALADCVGSYCGFPSKPVVKPPYDCINSDCPPRPDDPSATDEKRRTSFDGVFQALSDCVGWYCDFPPKPVVKPPYDCLNSDCPPRPDDPLGSSKKGTASAAVGNTYRVFLAPDEPGEKWIEDCWTFVADGRVKSQSGIELIWRMDWHNFAAATFQAVGPAGSNHGMAFYGVVSLSKSFEVAGIRSLRGAATAYSGYAHWVPGC